METLLFSSGQTPEGSHYVTEVKNVFGPKGKRQVQVEWSTGETSTLTFVFPYENMTEEVGEHSECECWYC